MLYQSSNGSSTTYSESLIRKKRRFKVLVILLRGFFVLRGKTCNSNFRKGKKGFFFKLRIDG